MNRFIGNYLSYFSIRFLFDKGPAEATYGMLPGTGVLYWFELIFLIAFFISLFKSRVSKEIGLLLIWVLIAPIPAALSTGVGYSANRVVIILPALTIISGIGAFRLYEFVKKYIPRNKQILAVTSISLMCLFFTGFIKNYFNNSNDISAKSMLYGNLEVFEWLKIGNFEKNIVVSKSLSEPQIYAAFVYKSNPSEYQIATNGWDYKKIGVNWVDQIPEYRLGNFSFRYIDWILKDKFDENSIFVGRPDNFPPGVPIIKDFKYPNADVAIIVVKND